MHSHAFSPRTSGALNLFRQQIGLLRGEDAIIGQALADVATICLLHERSTRENATVNAQLQNALTSRVFIEQAKGVIAERNGTTMHAVFQRFRQHAYSQQKPMHTCA